MSNTPGDTPPESAATTLAREYTAAYRAQLEEAVRVLTEAAQLPRPPLGPAAGGEPEQTDFADFIAQALAAVAANMGGGEALLAGRPGSWKADLVRQLVAGTVGHDDEHLWPHRTEPINITLYVDELVEDMSWSLSLDEKKPGMDYSAARDELDQRREAAEAQSPEIFTSERVWTYVRNDAGEFVATDPEAPAFSIDTWRALPSVQSAPEDVRAMIEAEITGVNLQHPELLMQEVMIPKSVELDAEITRLEEAEDARLAPFGELEEQLEAQRVRELTEYGQDLKARIVSRAALMGLGVPVNVTINLDDWRRGAPPAGLEGRLVEAALEDTPNPAELSTTPLQRLEQS